jgi:hypothetical protein
MGAAFLVSQKSFAPLGACGDKLVLGTALVTVLRLDPRGLASRMRKAAVPHLLSDKISTFAHGGRARARSGVREGSERIREPAVAFSQT